MIALLGGTFNPPHQGHIGAALSAADKLGIQINKHNYNIAKDNMFDKLISPFFFVSVSSV